MFEKRFLIILSIVNILVIGGLVVCYLGMDKEPPVITVNDMVTYSKDITEQEILSVIQAVDQKDGDVSETLIIEKIIRNEEKKTAWITFGARDESGNISKYTLCAPCDETVFEKVEIEGEVFQLAVGEAENMITPSAEEIQEASSEFLEETMDGASEAVEESTDEPSETVAEESDGDQVEEVAEETEQEENPMPAVQEQINESQEVIPTLVLSANEVRTKKGYNPAWVMVIAQLTDNTDSYETLLRNIKIQGAFDNTVVGSYDVLVSTTDSEGNESAASPLRIIVEE